jgi:hypothetical protein
MGIPHDILGKILVQSSPVYFVKLSAEKRATKPRDVREGEKAIDLSLHGNASRRESGLQSRGRGVGLH